MRPCQRRKRTSGRQSELSRRSFLGGIAAGTLAGGILGCEGQGGSPASQSGIPDRSLDLRGQSPIAAPNGDMGMPGPFPGRVVEVGHAGAVKDGRRDRSAIKAMIDQGMQQFVPDAETAVDAWRYFFQKGDRVAIKVVPVGLIPKEGANREIETLLVDMDRPGSISSYEVVLEVIDNLAAAGVFLGDILVVDRYRNEFIQAGYDQILPEGVHWECSSWKYDEAQWEIDGQIRGEPRADHVAGYDRDVFRELPFCQPPEYHSPDDERRFRSHLSKIVTQKVDKIISIPVLKDHRSAGITGALKNMSHGWSNNVARSHVHDVRFRNEKGHTLNHCQTFIPALCSLPPMREKCVLQIMDGLVGAYEGGPGTWNKTFATWEYKSLLFATDPVAMDRVGWKILDEKRVEEGWPIVSRMGLDAMTGIKPDILGRDGKPYGESFHIRHPQHIPLAGLLGLGQFDLKAIDHQRTELEA